MKALTYFFACLLLVLLPLQGMAAAQMLACNMAASIPAQAHAEHAEHAQMDAQHSAHAQHTMQDQHSEKSAHGSCQQCGACCIAAAPLLPLALMAETDFRLAPQVWHAIAINSAPISPPERPPRLL